MNDKQEMSGHFMVQLPALLGKVMIIVSRSCESSCARELRGYLFLRGRAGNYNPGKLLWTARASVETADD